MLNSNCNCCSPCKAVALPWHRFNLKLRRALQTFVAVQVMVFEVNYENLNSYE